MVSREYFLLPEDSVPPAMNRLDFRKVQNPAPGESQTSGRVSLLPGQYKDYTSRVQKINGIQLAVFLGNPGERHSGTRHNIARSLLKYLPGAQNLQWKEKFNGKISGYYQGKRQCRFLLPETFMNASGQSLSKAVDFYRIALNNLLVIHDDLELPFGQYSLRSGGGLAGHNGLKSIRESLDASDFCRLRLGIGRPSRGSVRSWVLGGFTPEEQAVLPLILDHAATTLLRVLEGCESIQGKSEPITIYPASP